MSRRCSKTPCDNPGVIYVRAGLYLCEPHGTEARLEIARAAAMSEPVSQAEIDHHNRQVANSHSLTDVYPALRDPVVLSQQIEFWREIESRDEENEQ